MLVDHIANNPTPGSVNRAIQAAQSVPDLITHLKAVDPALAEQISGKALFASKSPWGTLLGAALAWASARWGFGWDDTTSNLVAGAGLLVGAYVMRLFTTAPVSGVVSVPKDPAP